MLPAGRKRRSLAVAIHTKAFRESECAMSDLTRRHFLGATAAVGGLAAAAEARDIGAVNKPDPLLDGAELPTFKFALEKSKGHVIGGNSAMEATVKQLPISKGIAGVTM